MSVVRYELDGHVAIITLDRPQKLNAFNSAMHADLDVAIRRFRADADAWVAVVTGAGERAFSAGQDVSELADLDDFMASQPGFWDAVYSDRIDREMEQYKPMIAAVNGHCVGEGLCLAMACDLRVASEDATFLMPEVALGIPIVVGAAQSARLMGLGHVMELLLLGEPRDAAWAHRVGLINKIVPKSDVLSAALTWAHRLASVGPLAVRCTREIAIRSLDTDFSTAIRMGEAMRRVATGLSGDFREGVTAAAEGRSPHFTGR